MLLLNRCLISKVIAFLEDVDNIDVLLPQMLALTRLVADLDLLLVHQASNLLVRIGCELFNLTLSLVLNRVVPLLYAA